VHENKIMQPAEIILRRGRGDEGKLGGMGENNGGGESN
jgi:hypothetical protein